MVTRTRCAVVIAACALIAATAAPVGAQTDGAPPAAPAAATATSVPDSPAASAPEPAPTSVPTPVAATSTGGGRLVPVWPARLADTRASGAGGCVTAERAVQFAGRLGIPADAAAVAVSITVTGATAPGFLRVWPDGTTQPTTAVMNFPAASGITNNALVRPGTSGSVRVAAYGGCAHVIIDAVGYYTSGAPVASGLVTIAPTRLADTRSPGAGGCVTGERPIQIADRSGIPSNATAVAVNVTVTGATAPGFLRLWPNGESQPASALVNYQAAVGISNGTAAKVGTSSSIRVWASGGCPHVIVDAVGYYTSGTSGPGAFVPIAPRRALDTRAPGSGGCVVGERELVVSPWNQASGGVPAGAAAVTLNVTIPDATDAGFLRVWPGRSPQPGAAAMNYQARSGISNGTTVRVGDDGSVRFWASGGCPHVIVDVVGYTVG